MIYYNKKVAEAAGVDPTKWKSLDDMCADQKKVKDAGYTFIAMGGNTFQAGYTFHALLAAIAGPDIYNRFYGDGTPDETVFDEPGCVTRSRRSARSPHRPIQAGSIARGTTPPTP